MKALCVIDIQKDWLDRPRRHEFPKGVAESLIRNSNQVIQREHAAGTPVIYIRHVSRSWPAKVIARVFFEGLSIAGAPGCELDARLDVVSRNVFDKERSSSFSSLPFREFLENNGIDELVLIGLDGCFCVKATARQALREGFKVSLVEPAIATSFSERWKTKITPELQKRGARLLTAI